MITQKELPVVRPLADYEPFRSVGTAAIAVRPHTPGDAIEGVLHGIPDQRTARRPREDLSRKQVEIVLTALLEVHSGHRPPSRVTDWLAQPLTGRLLDEKPRHRPRYHLRSAHLCRTSDHSLEVAATAWVQSRLRAVTARFERHARQWRCTHFAVIEPRSA